MSGGAPRDGADILVVGGGLVGSAIAWGLARAGARVAVLDEGDVAHRASRGNFALVWVQSKGLGMPDYGAWTRLSSDRWAELAAALADETGIDVAHHRPGGFTLCLSDEELGRRVEGMRRLHNQPHGAGAPYEVLDGDETRRRLPAAGPEVAGSVFCPLDGHVNSLRLFRALHVALRRRGADYRPNHPVETVRAEGRGFVAAGPWGELRAGRIVLAAGLANARLAPMLGMAAPVTPSKGQIIVTEKAAPFLHHPTVTVRQTDEGGVMVGDSQEDLGLDTRVASPVISLMARRAVRMFPALAALNVVRSWSALRVMSPDGFPIYAESASHPGAFVASCHSGVTLAAAHALALAPAIAAGSLPGAFGAFSPGRFRVPQAA